MAVTRNMMLSAANRMVESFFELGDQGREVTLRMNIEGDDQGRASCVTLSFESDTKADETTKEHVGPQETLKSHAEDWGGGTDYNKGWAICADDVSEPIILLYADGANYHQYRALYPEPVVVLRPTLTNLTGRTADMIMVSNCIDLDADCQRQGSYRSLMTKRLKDPSQPLLVLSQSTLC